MSDTARKRIEEIDKELKSIFRQVKKGQMMSEFFAVNSGMKAKFNALENERKEIVREFLKNNRKNPSQSQITRCRKVLSESERETHKPTISHYRDMNGIKTKNPVLVSADYKQIVKLLKAKAERYGLTLSAYNNGIQLKKNNSIVHIWEKYTNYSSLYSNVNAYLDFYKSNPQAKTSVKNPSEAELRKALLKPQFPKDEFSLEWLAKHGKEKVKTEAKKRLKKLQVKNPNDLLTMLVKKFDRTASGSIPFTRLNAKEKEIILSNDKWFKTSKDYTGINVRLSNYAYEWLEGKQNGATVKNKNSSDKEYIFLIVPKNSQSQEASLELSTFAPSKARALAIVKAQARNFGKDVKKYNFRFLSARNGINKKPNFASKEFNVSKTLDKHSRMFQGSVSNELKNVAASDFAADNLFRLGKLKLVKVQNGKDVYDLEFDINDEAYLAGDIRKNLHFVGKDARLPNNLRPKNNLEPFGKMIQVDYVTAKNHIGGGKTIHFYHEHGEVDGITPTICRDKNGFLVLLNDGNYDIWKEGIVN